MRRSIEMNTANKRKVRLFTLLSVSIAICTLLIVNFGCNNGDKNRIEKFFNVEKEIAIQENIGKKFSPRLDYEEIIDSISKAKSDSSPHDYGKFCNSVKNIHEEILNYLAENLKLPEKTRKEVLKQYRNYHDDFSRDYFNRLIEQKNSTLAPNTQSFVTYDSVISAQHFTNLLSANICNLAGFILTLATSKSVDTNPVGLLLGKSCQTILNLLLKPIAMKIKRAAVIKDYTISRISLKNHIRDMIFELGTVADSFATDFDEQYKLELILGLKSEAHLNVHARFTIKAGFKLHRLFQLEYNHTLKEILITLPSPEILSNVVETQIVNMKNGLLVKIDRDKLNDLNDRARIWGINKAIKSGILENAKKNVEMILETIFQPIILATDPEYKIAINFKNLPGQQNKIKLLGSSNSKLD
jgi:hypothetical protein